MAMDSFLSQHADQSSFLSSSNVVSSGIVQLIIQNNSLDFQINVSSTVCI